MSPDFRHLVCNRQATADVYKISLKSMAYEKNSPLQRPPSRQGMQVMRQFLPVRLRLTLRAPRRHL
jgi:hypothetical protein